MCLFIWLHHSAHGGVGSPVTTHRLSCPGTWDLHFPIRDRICIPCIGRWILTHWTTREVLGLLALIGQPQRVVVPLLLRALPGSQHVITHHFYQPQYY